MPARNLLSTFTVATVGLACKAFLRLGFCSSVTVTGLHHLLSALNDDDRNRGKGVVTVSNHISVLDDPLAWGVLPASTYLHSRTTRWALGASDIMFTNPVFSEFFRQGQVLETFRGKGMYQRAVDVAIEKLNNGAWVHLFGEGKVNQPDTYQVGINGEVRLPRFKWGTGRIIMETEHMPTVIPMWLTGFDKIMPEPRSFPRFLPRLRKSVSVAFGPPMDPAKLQRVLDTWRTCALRESIRKHTLVRGEGVDSSDNGSDVPPGEEREGRRHVRRKLTDVLQSEVEALGRTVSGPLLGKQLV